tara:strand:- start:52 stop:1065 length:1014 start_codon:yes stop_codon:yes gene_type:complete
VNSTEEGGVRRISANLPQKLIDGVDHLKLEWGLRSRGAVIERLLDDVFSDINDSDNNLSLTDEETNESDIIKQEEIKYNEDKAIVLIGKSDIEVTINPARDKLPAEDKIADSPAINLPGFVSKRTTTLRHSLKNSSQKVKEFSPSIYTVKEIELNNSLNSAKNHWISLYGNKPSENVIEAAMIWLARDIWPHVDGSEDSSFTWSAANKLMIQYCKTWQFNKPDMERIIVLAGVLEDPFSSNNLENRVPTIIRRFVNSYKRRQNITSFQTIESTMTVHGALKLLGLPTLAGSSLTLNTIRDAYKTKAMENHPDSGGSTEIMRKLNEGYQLLKDLYKSK